MAAIVLRAGMAAEIVADAEAGLVAAVADAAAVGVLVAVVAADVMAGTVVVTAAEEGTRTFGVGFRIEAASFLGAAFFYSPQGARGFTGESQLISCRFHAAF